MPRMPASVVHRFGPFELRAASGTLLRNGEALTLTPRQVAVLSLLIRKAGTVVSRGEVMAAGWSGEAVADNSVDKVISDLRRLLGHTPEGEPYVATLRRRGFRFPAGVSHEQTSGFSLEALLAPYHQWIEGRAALETLHIDQIHRARTVFEEAVRSAPRHAPAHVGLANACVMQFEATRADAQPDVAALALAIRHGLLGCELDADYAEAWATLGFVVSRAAPFLSAIAAAAPGMTWPTPTDALAAARRATMIEKENWRHQARLAAVAWGEERLSAARRVLAKVPGFPIAHLFAATVFVARQTFDDAEREVLAGIAGQEAQLASGAPFSGVALHWLHGLLRLAAGDPANADAAFARELSFERDGHIYARECAAHSFVAIGAMRLRESDAASAVTAFQAALARVPAHPMAHAGLAIARRRMGTGGPLELPPAVRGSAVDLAMARAALLVEGGEGTQATVLVNEALAAPQAGGTGWILSIEPLLDVRHSPLEWSGALARLRGQAL